MRETSAPVSRWLVDALALRPGHAVLELAGGGGETGLIAAALVGPGGRLISSDRSAPMLTTARSRAALLGLENVEFRLLDAEAIDLPLASMDAVICRWGYMLMTDPGAALRETRRVLRPGGRVALAVWDAPERNPWSAIPSSALVASGLREPAEPGEPGPFALGDPERVRTLLEDAGFTEIDVSAVDLLRPDPDFEAWWAGYLALSGTSRAAVAGADAQTLARVKAQIRGELAPYTASDGSLLVAARTLVAAAGA